MDEATASRNFADLDVPADMLVARCRTLRADWTMIRALTRYLWWPTDAPLAILS